MNKLSTAIDFSFYMDREEKIELIDKFLKELYGLKNGLSTLPESLYGKIPDEGSDLETKCTILEDEVLKLGFVEIFGKGVRPKENNYFYYLKILSKGSDLCRDGKSVREVYDKIEKNESAEQTFKDLRLRNAKLENDLKKFQVIKDYFWLMSTTIAIVGAIVGYWVRGFQF